MSWRLTGRSTPSFSARGSHGRPFGGEIMRRILLFALLLAVGCRPSERAAKNDIDTPSAAKDGPNEQEVANDEALFLRTLQGMRSVGSNATELTIYEVANEFDSDYAKFKDHPKAAGYPIRRQSKLSAPKARPLLDSLTNRAAYLPAGEAWSCLFEPHHVLEASVGKQRMTFIICVKCGDVEHVVGTESIGTHSLTPAGNAEVDTLLKKALRK
jgi:hypothetical protein